MAWRAGVRVSAAGRVAWRGCRGARDQRRREFGAPPLLGALCRARAPHERRQPPPPPSWIAPMPRELILFCSFFFFLRQVCGRSAAGLQQVCSRSEQSIKPRERCRARIKSLPTTMSDYVLIFDPRSPAASQAACNPDLPDWTFLERPDEDGYGGLPLHTGSAEQDFAICTIPNNCFMQASAFEYFSGSGASAFEGIEFLLPEPASAPQPEALAPPAPGEHEDAAAAAPRQHKGVAWSAELQTVWEFELSDEERRYKRSLLEYMRDAMEEDEEEEEEEAGPSGASAFEYLQVLQQQKDDINSERTSTMSALLVQETCPKVRSCFVDQGMWNENEKRFDGPPDWEFVEARLQALCKTSIPEEAGVLTNDSEKVKSLPRCQRSSKTKKPADKKSWERKKSAPKKSAPKKIIEKTAPFTPKIVLYTSTNSVADAASVESFESFTVDEEAFIVQDMPLLAAGADMIDPAALMDETERKHYEKLTALMTPEEFAVFKANGVFYSRKDPKRPDLMCQCGKVQRMKNGFHRFRDCQNARCHHLKRGGKGHLFRKACSKCSPHNFCSKCLSSATGEPLRLDQCRCPQGAKVPMARV